MGYSAGGIQAEEFLLNFDEDVLPTALDPDYIPDELDEVSAHASAAGMIYSFYGRLSVASMDADELREIKERLIPFMVSECGRHGVSRVYFMLTDIMEQSTELLFYGEGSEEMAVNAFKIEPKDGTIYLKGVVSRKKQLIPPLMEAAQMIGSDYV